MLKMALETPESSKAFLNLLLLTRANYTEKSDVLYVDIIR